MTRKAAWILVLLAVLLAISVSVAFASSVTQPAHAAAAQSKGISTAGDVTVSTLSGISSGRYKLIQVPVFGFGHCHEEESAAY